jgi:hypothetical protein
VEVAQKKQEERRAAEDMAGEIVERVVEETTVEKQRQTWNGTTGQPPRWDAPFAPSGNFA